MYCIEFRIRNRCKALGLLLLLFTAVAGQNQQPTLVGEGKIVAYQTFSRCDGCAGFQGGIGIRVERWIVRVSKWPDTIDGKPDFILILYERYNRSPSKDMIQHTLRFKLRPLDDDVKPVGNCVGTIVERQDESLVSRKSVLSDYTVTEDLDDGSLTDFDDFPCFVVDELPLAVDQ